MLSIEENLEEIRLYLKDNINNLKKSDTWKNQSTIAIDFMPSKDMDENHTMHSKSDGIEIRTSKETDELLNFFHHFLLDIKWRINERLYIDFTD